MLEEQIRFDAGRMPTKASPPAKPAKPTKSGYEGYIPQLQAQSNLWGLPTKKPPEPAAPHAQQSQPTTRKAMTVEEIEAAMRAQRNQAPKPQSVTAMDQLPRPAHEFPPSVEPWFMPEPTRPPPANITMPPQLQILQRSQHQGPPQAPAAQRQQQPVQAELPAPGIQHPQILQRQRQTQPQTQSLAMRASQQQVQVPAQEGGARVKPRQILQNPNRLSGQGTPGSVQQPVDTPQRTSPAATGHHRGPSYQGPIITNPQQILQLSEEDRAAFLQEEAKRAKRNHKIAMMAKYNGLMTPQDKNFISRIQLTQLLSASNNLDEQGPEAQLADDFYYQVYSQIRAASRQNPHEPANKFAQTYLFQTGGRSGYGRRYHRGGDNHMQRMEQQVQRAVTAAKERSKNKPTNFEGSLGKISFSNAKTPKPLLSIRRAEGELRPHTPSQRPSHYDAAAERRTALRNIEKIYESLMKMEDHERRLPPRLHEESDPDTIQAHMEWREKLQELHNELWSDLRVMAPIDSNSPTMHPFIAILSYAKGKKLLPRVWRHIDERERLTTITLIIVNLDSLDVVARAIPVSDSPDSALSPAVKEEVELFISTVTPSLFTSITDSSAEVTMGLLGILVDHNTPRTLVLTKVGLIIITMLISRIEVLKSAPQGASLANFPALFNTLFDAVEPTLPHVFASANGGARDADDVHVWQFLAAMGAASAPEQQQRLVLGVKERVMETVRVSRALPEDLAERRLGCVNLFLRAIGLDVELLIED
jgi:DNA topoisomerase 2-associated protein PAT1